jgi:hypothetical protein
MLRGPKAQRFKESQYNNIIGSQNFIHIIL